MAEGRADRDRRWRWRVRRFWFRELRPRWEDIRWFVVGALAATAFGLGTWGFALHFEAIGEPRSLADSMYRAIQLFVLEFGSSGFPIPWPLQVARFLAPAVAFYTAISALAALFRAQLARIKAGWSKDHVLVCGLGRAGLLLAKTFSKQYRVVAIEKDETNPAIDELREEGVIVLAGDASDRALLKKASATDAAYLFAVSGDDGINRELAVAVKDVVRERTQPLPCFVHVLDVVLLNMMREAAASEGDQEAFTPEYFNFAERGAPGMLHDYPGFVEMAGSGPPHLLVIGLGQMGTNAVVHAARGWRIIAGPEAGPLRVTALDLQAELRARTLLRLYPWLDDICNLRTVDVDVASPDFEAERHMVGPDGPPVTSVYVCLNDDAFGWSIGRQLAPYLDGTPARIRVRRTERGELAPLMAPRGSREVLQEFRLLEWTCRPEVLLQGDVEILARAIHDDWLRDELEKGRTRDPGDYLTAWEDLNEEQRETNRRAAEHIGAKLAAVRCERRRLADPDWDGSDVGFRETEVELLAEMEHRRWWQDKQRQGFRLGPERDYVGKETPLLVPWEDLSEEEKDKDRRQMRRLPATLARAGFSIVRMDPVIGRVAGEVARAIHEEYVRHEREAGRTPGTNPSMVAWEALPDSVKESNIDQAWDIPRKLAAVGCGLGPVSDAGAGRFSEEELELLARMEHDRWVRQRRVSGWSLGTEKDPERKITPHLVPWDDLSEEVRDYDRRAVMGIPGVLEAVGLQVVRPRGDVR